jgi:succinate dehydrogenase / fumarate reductase cytochrome b subunit
MTRPERATGDGAQAERNMQQAVTLYGTSIGKKAVMAVSGAIILGFSIGHLSGNLKVFSPDGARAFNEYAAFLRTVPMVLWGTRIALLFAFGAHAVTAFQLWRRNKNARPVAYRKHKDLETDFAAKTMYVTGPILLGYVLFHLAHLTFGATFGTFEFEKMNPYNNLVHSFEHPGFVAIYSVAMLALGFHLFHGIYSVFQTIGANHEKYNGLRRDLAVALSVLITAGYLSIPLAVVTGFLKPTTTIFYLPELE